MHDVVIVDVAYARQAATDALKGAKKMSEKRGPYPWRNIAGSVTYVVNGLTDRLVGVAYYSMVLIPVEDKFEHSSVIRTASSDRPVGFLRYDDHGNSSYTIIYNAADQQRAFSEMLKLATTEFHKPKVKSFAFRNDLRSAKYVAPFTVLKPNGPRIDGLSEYGLIVSEV